MRKPRRRRAPDATLWIAGAALSAAPFADAAYAGDRFDLAHPTYVAACGACPVACPPQWLPAPLPPALGKLREGFAHATLAPIGMHVLAVVASSLLHWENLVRAMGTGFKRAAAGAPAAGKRTVMALALIAAVGAFWGGQIPSPGLDTQQSASATTSTVVARAAHRHDD